MGSHKQPKADFAVVAQQTLQYVSASCLICKEHITQCLTCYMAKEGNQAQGQEREGRAQARSGSRGRREGKRGG